MVEEIRNLRTDVDNLEKNVITNSIDEYSKLNNPLVKDHNTFIVYSDGWTLNDENNSISKKCNGMESVHILFNLMKALEYKEITGIEVDFEYYNCKINSVAIGDGDIWNYCNKDTTDLVTSNKDYIPQSELEDTTGKHVEYMLTDDGSRVEAGENTFMWNFDQENIKRLLYTTGARVQINLEPTSVSIPVEINKLQFKVYFKSALQNEVDVIYNRLEVMNLPELIKQQSPVQYIYFQSATTIDDIFLEEIQEHCNKKFNKTEYESDDYVPEKVTVNDIEYTFTNEELFVSDKIHVVYIMSRSKQNDVYGKYGVPQIYSIYGTGESNIYYQFAYMTKSDADAPATPSHSDEDNLPPGGWTAYPGEISPTVKYCFVTSRVKQNGKWGDWSAPVLFSVYSVDGKDGEKGDTGAKGTDGNTVLSLYINGTDTPTAPSIVKGTIKDIDGVAYTDYEVTPDTIQELFNIIKEDTGSLSPDLIGTDLTDKYGDLYMAYRDWSVEPLPATDQLNTYVTVMNYNPSSDSNGWGSSTLYALATGTNTDTGGSDTGSIGLVPDDMDTVPLGTYTTMNLYRFGSLVLCRINWFKLKAPSSVRLNLGTISDEIFKKYDIGGKFSFLHNTVGMNNLSNDAYLGATPSTKTIYIHFNNDTYSTNKSDDCDFQGEKVWYLEQGEDTEVNLTATGTKPTITVEAGGRLYVTLYGDGTDDTRDGKQIINQLSGRQYILTIFEHDTPKTFYKSDGTSFDTTYYTEQPINHNPGTHGGQKSTLVYDGTYKTTIHDYNLKVVKIKLKVTAVKLSNNMVRFNLTDSTGDTLLSTRLNIMTWSDTVGYHKKVGHSNGYIDVPCKTQAGLMVMGNSRDNGKLLCESLNGKTWSRNSVTKNGTTCLAYYVKLSDLTTE